MNKLILSLLVLCSSSLFSQVASNEKLLAYSEAKNLTDKGFEKYDSQDYKVAILDFNKAIERDPKYYRAYYWRGRSKEESGDYIGAILDYNKVIELNPNDDYAYFYRGESKINLGDYRGLY